MAINAWTHQVSTPRCFSKPPLLPNIREKTRDVVAKNRRLGQYVRIGDRGHVNCDDDGREKGNNHIADFVGFGKSSRFLSMAAVGSVRINNSDEGMD